MTAPPARNSSAPVLALLASAVLWGMSWWPLKQFSAVGISGNAMALVSYGLLALVGLPVLWAQRALWRPRVGLLLLIALLGGWANTAFVNALVLGDVVRVMLLFYLAPVWGILAGRLFLHEPITPRRALAVVLALFGAATLLGGPAALAVPPTPIDLLALSAGMAFALNNVSTRAAHGVPLASKTLIVFVGCAVVAGAAAWSQGNGIPPLRAPTWGLLALFSLTWLGLATLATQFGVSHLEAGRAAVLLILELVAAVVSAVVIGGESLTARELIGGGLIASAALIEIRGKATRKERWT